MERLTSEQLKQEQEKTLAAPRMRYGLLARLLFVAMDLLYGKEAIGVAVSLLLRQCLVRNFSRGRNRALELHLFGFEFMDPLFQIGDRMFGFFHRAIFSIDRQR